MPTFAPYNVCVRVANIKKVLHCNNFFEEGWSIAYNGVKGKTMNF